MTRFHDTPWLVGELESCVRSGSFQPLKWLTCQRPSLLFEEEAVGYHHPALAQLAPIQLPTPSRQG